MLDDYKCKCGHITEYTKSYGKSFPKTIKCEKCGNRAKRVISGKKIIVPEEMRSVNN